MMRKIWILVSLLFIFIPNSVSANDSSERVFITFNETINQTVLENQEVELHHVFKQYNAVSATIPSSLKLKLSHDPSVKRIESDPIVTSTMQRENWGLKTVLARDAHANNLTGKGVKIGVIDSGIYLNHPDLEVAGGVSFVEKERTYNDRDGHGTHVAGIIGALNNEIGTVGVAPDAELYAIKVIGANGVGNQSDVVKGIEWALNKHLHIVNLSITTTQYSTIMERIFHDAYEKGLLMISAAGNTETALPSSVNVLYPGRFPSVISVGSINTLYKKSWFSYFGQSLEFVAPGEDIYSTYVPRNKNELYASASGTSMAAPYVTGVAALYKEAYPMLNNKGIRELMQETAHDLGATGKDPIYGYGLVQAPTQLNFRPFPDLKKGSWYEAEVTELYNEGIVTGYEDGYFYPKHNVTRAAAITMIGRALGLDGEKQATRYKDVPADHFASGYIASATNKQIITGLPNNEFRPSAPITRADVAVMLERAFVIEEKKTTPFRDVDKEKYFAHAVHLLKGADITTGYLDGTYRPLNNITRAEFSVMLMRALNSSSIK